MRSARGRLIGSLTGHRRIPLRSCRGPRSGRIVFPGLPRRGQPGSLGWGSGDRSVSCCGSGCAAYGSGEPRGRFHSGYPRRDKRTVRMNTHQRLASAIAAVVHRLTATADAVAESGLGIRKVADGTSAAPGTITAAGRRASDKVSEVDPSRAQPVSAGSSDDRAVITWSASVPSGNRLSAVPDLHGYAIDRVEATMRGAGFSFRSQTSGGYRRYTAGDGSEIWIRPDGEVQRLGPKVSPGPNQRSYRQRYGPDGAVTKDHSTGERVSR